MKGNEIDYLDKLFAPSSGAAHETEVEFPIIEVSEDLSAKLYAITGSASDGVVTVKRGVFERWPRMASIAASLLVAIVGFQFYQQQQTLKQLEHAQGDLVTALHYLGEANRIARTQIFNSLNNNMNKAGVVPALGELPRPEEYPEIEKNTPTRSL